MTVTINGTTGITSPEVVLDNAAADGGQVVLKSSGYSNWNWDNYSGRLRAYYNATEYFTIDTSGNVGVGTSSPSNFGKFAVQNGTIAAASADGTVQSIHNAANTGQVKLSSYNGAGTSYLTFGTGSDTERMRIDSSGNVGVGTTSPSSYGKFAVQTDGSAVNGMAVYSPSLTNGAKLTLFDNNNNAGFYTVPSASSALAIQVNGTERARITSNGSFLVNKTTVTDAGEVGFIAYSGGAITATINDSASSVNSLHLYNLNATNNGYRFYVNSNGGIRNYSGNNTNLSDERTKTNIELAGNYLDKVCAIPVKLFNYKSEPEGEQRTLGVIAQDVEAVAPELVDTDGWLGEAPDGEPPLKSVYTTDMMFALMKSIQELNAKVDSLQETVTAQAAKIEALEAKNA